MRKIMRLANTAGRVSTGIGTIFLGVAVLFATLMIGGSMFVQEVTNGEQ